MPVLYTYGSTVHIHVGTSPSSALAALGGRRQAAASTGQRSAEKQLQRPTGAVVISARALCESWAFGVAVQVQLAAGLAVGYRWLRCAAG